MNAARFRTIILSFYFMFIAVILTGCTIPIIGVEVAFPSWVPFLGNGSSQPTTLEYWGLWEPDTIIQPLFDRYKTERNRENLTIDYQMRDPRQHFETVRARLSTDNPPDIVRVHATWVPYLLPFLEPMPTDLMNTNDFRSTFYPVVSEDLVFGERVYGMPLGIDGLALVYNETIFQQAGITEPPRTWDAFRDYAQRMTRINASGQMIQSGAAFGLADNVSHFSDILGLMFAQSGVRFVDEQGRVMFHQSFAPDGRRNLGVEALKFYAQFGSTEPTYTREFESGSIPAFIEGKVGMIFAPSYELINIMNAQPNFNVRVAPVPQFPASEFEAVNWATYWVEVVPRNGQNPREAWRLLLYMTEPEALVDFNRRASAVRGFGEPYPRLDLADTLALDQRVSVYVQQGPTYTSWSFADKTHDVVLNDRIVDALTRAVNETVGNNNAAEGALQQAARDVQTVLDGFAS